MFNITQLKDQAEQAWFFMEDKQAGRPLKDPLGSFVQTWESEECQRYLGGFGKLIFMAKLDREKKDSMAEVNYNFLNFGAHICSVYKTKALNHHSLQPSLFGIYTLSPLVKQYTEEIKASFVRG
jgi:hypothetical protein